MRADGHVQSYFFKYEANFRRDYVEAVPHRPRWAQRKFKKRIGIYKRRVVVPPPPGLYVKVTVFYEGSQHGSYHIDCGIVEWNGDVADLKARLKKNVMKKLGWHDWNEIEMSLGLRVGVAKEKDGRNESWCEVWRV